MESVPSINILISIAPSVYIHTYLGAEYELNFRFLRITCTYKVASPLIFDT